MTLRPDLRRNYFDPDGNLCYFVAPSAIANEYFFTPSTGKIWFPVLKEITIETFDGSDRRFLELKQLGEKEVALSKVKTSDLVKLGYLEPRSTGA